MYQYITHKISFTSLVGYFSSGHDPPPNSLTLTIILLFSNILREPSLTHMGPCSFSMCMMSAASFLHALSCHPTDLDLCDTK